MMRDTISYWTRVMASLQTIGETNSRMARTAEASRDVIASRTSTIADAFRSPMTGDYLELSRMVPEKIAAFSMSGNAVLQAWWNIQAEWIEQAQQMTAMTTRGRIPTLYEVYAATSRSCLFALHAFEAGSNAGRGALAPVYKTATANARRLNKRR